MNIPKTHLYSEPKDSGELRKGFTDITWQMSFLLKFCFDCGLTSR